MYFCVVDLNNLVYISPVIFRAVKSNYMQNNQAGLRFSGNLDIFPGNSIEWKNYPETHYYLFLETPCIMKNHIT